MEPATSKKTPVARNTGAAPSPAPKAAESKRHGDLGDLVRHDAHAERLARAAGEEQAVCEAGHGEVGEGGDEEGSGQHADFGVALRKAVHLGAMAALLISGAACDAIDPLQDALRREENIDVPIFRWGNPRRRVLRISAQLYNIEDEFRRLASALRSRLAAE